MNQNTKTEEYNEYNQKSFMFLYFGQAVSLFGSVLTTFVIIFHLTMLTQSALVLTILTLLVTVPAIFITPFGGVLIDKFSRKYLLGSADFFQAFFTLALIWVFINEATNILLIILLLGIKGIFQPFHQSIFSAIIPSMVPRDKLMQKNSIMQLGNALVGLMAPIIAALFIALATWPVYQLLWIDVVTFLIAAFILIFIKIPKVVRSKQQEGQENGFFSEFKEGLSFLRRGKGFIPLLLTFAFINFTFAPLSVLLPLLILIYHSGNALDFALVTILLQGGIIFASILLSTKVKVTKLISGFLVAILGIYVSILFVAVAPQGELWILFLSFLIVGVCLAVSQVSATTIWHKTVPLHLQGRVASVRTTLSTSISPLGVLFAGLFADELGANNLILYFAIIGLLILFFMFMFTSLRHVEHQDTEDVDSKEVNTD
ncbi:MAG: hypothetical protein HeimC3_49960 [Candidatus Heimdallarchaeota archaeon LC_3]|nr:MAG: hypothetical protein HeimC3_49960 [Candidatus Heimdallarchaeota archaeon LC_3]